MTAILPNPIPPAPGPRPFTVLEYQRMIRAGVLTEDDAVELLEGWVVYKMPRDPAHDATIDRAHEALLRRVGTDWRVRDQSAITTGDSQPEPDLAVALGPAGRYDTRPPAPEDLALVVEVANSSLAIDRDEKGRIYGRAGIPTYWIINLVDRCVEVYNDPSGPASVPSFRSRTDYRPGDSIPLTIMGRRLGDVPVDELLPGNP